LRIRKKTNANLAFSDKARTADGSRFTAEGLSMEIGI
jgi:hypothetical protein